MSKNLKLLIVIFICVAPAFSLKCHFCIGNLKDGVPQGTSALCTDPEQLSENTLQTCDTLDDVDLDFQLSTLIGSRIQDVVYQCFKRSRSLPNSEIVKRGCYAGLEKEDCMPPSPEELETNEKLDINKVNFDNIKQDTCFCDTDGCNTGTWTGPSFCIIAIFMSIAKILG